MQRINIGVLRLLAKNGAAPPGFAKTFTIVILERKGLVEWKPDSTKLPGIRGAWEVTEQGKKLIEEEVCGLVR